MRNQKAVEFDSSSSCDSWAAPETLNYQARSSLRTRGRKHALLEKIIENKIIPRLLLANPHILPTPAAAIDATAAMLAERIDEFAELVVNRDATASIAYFAALRSDGASTEALFHDLLAPAARRLGELWDEDINDFMDVTRGVAHLQQIVHEFSAEFEIEGRSPVSNRRALLMPMPGEQHTFGVALIGEHFRREGWRVWGGPPRATAEIMELVDSQWFDMVGLSLSKVPDAANVAATVNAIRQASLNKQVAVLVGGRVFDARPELVSAVGADATASDGRGAVLQVAQLIGPSAKST